jgi:GxxExxY protein
MDTNKHESMRTDIIFKEDVYQIISCAFEVINEMGHGLHEKPYELALVVEFGLRNIPCLQQPQYEIGYKGHSVGKFIPDLIVFEKIVIDTKTINHITDHERGQMINYLRITKHPVGLILNFKHSKLEWERIVL